MRLLIVFAVLFCVSCTPKFSYLGDTSSPNVGKVDTYYDQGDVEKEYTVMGMLSANSIQSFKKDMNHIREKMVIEAGMKGADAILFINMETTDIESDDSLVTAKLLKYK